MGYVKKEFIEMMKNDMELQELRKKVFAITGKRKDIAFCVGANYTYEEWKEQSREIVRQHEAANK